MEASGVSPLLLATLGFLRTVCQHSLEDEPLIARGLRLMGLLGTVALALAVAGGVIEGEATKESSLTSGQNLRHIGVILFVVLLGLIILVHVFCWMNSGRILKHRRTLLAGISVALPFLVVRVAYTVLSAYAPLTRSIAADGQVTSITSDSPLTKFNSTTGPWIIYLLMSVVPEFIAVVIYVIVGTKIPLQDDTDYSRGAMSEAWDQGSDEEHARLKPLRTASSNYSQY
ncbi:hypothetical protein WOLCODRAFT_135031 [Wolfiporia cocos MD-104 SS10]|uniref:DUF7702 domain-containing protein n=1 Tax=Wolfiporia cocos (strain MD-104) TaxID=742152 RepID=A0A2H3ITI6_WOLCO|nr:hypothetical protein WOLCODRAFT_135031 [Wolfiporia cocos MD-104 SS10]